MKTFRILRRVIDLHTTVLIYVRLMVTLSCFWLNSSFLPCSFLTDIVNCFVFGKFQRTYLLVLAVRYLFSWSWWKVEPPQPKVPYKKTGILCPLFHLLKLLVEWSKKIFCLKYWYIAQPYSPCMSANLLFQLYQTLFIFRHLLVVERSILAVKSFSTVSACNT